MVEIGWVRRGWARSESAMWRLTAHTPHRARASPDHKPSPSPRTQTTTRYSSTPSRASCASARSLDCCTPTGLPSLPSPALGARTPIDPHSAFLSPANSHSQLGAQNGTMCDYTWPPSDTYSIARSMIIADDFPPHGPPMIATE